MSLVNQPPDLISSGLSPVTNSRSSARSRSTSLLVGSVVVTARAEGVNWKVWHGES